MEHRYLKIAVTLSVGVLALFYVAHNFANWSGANAAVAYVLSLADHTVYPVSLAPPVTQPVLISALVLVICAGEAAAATLSLIGSWKLWVARRAGAAEFASAKRYAVMGSGLAVLVWFLLFQVGGGALYQMWQTETGVNSLEGAFQFSGMSFLTLIYLSLPEPEVQASS